MSERKKRFFAFGCSYTQWTVYTYADIIGHSSFANDNYYNYGCAGAGNNYIFTRFMEADQYHRFTHDDLIIVQWSSCLRESRYRTVDNYTKWHHYGCIHTLEQREIVDFLYNDRGYLVQDLARIKAVKDRCESIGCDFAFTSMCGISASDTDHDNWQFTSSTEHGDVLNRYSDVLSIIRPSYYSVLHKSENGRWDNRRPVHLRDDVYFHDSHPTPGEHLYYISTCLPEYLQYVDQDKFLELETIFKKTYIEEHIHHIFKPVTQARDKRVDL